MSGQAGLWWRLAGVAAIAATALAPPVDGRGLLPVAAAVAALVVFVAASQVFLALARPGRAVRVSTCLATSILYGALNWAGGGFDRALPVLFFFGVFDLALSVSQVEMAAGGLFHAGLAVGVAALNHQLDAAHRPSVLMVALLLPVFGGMVNSLAASVSRRWTLDAELDNLARHNGVIAEAFSRLRLGDVSPSTRIDFDGDLGSFAGFYTGMADSFNSTVAQFRKLVSRVQETGATVVKSSEELMIIAGQSAGAAAKQSAAVTETSTTIEELASTAAQIATTANLVASLAEQTARQAAEGRKAMGATAEGINRVADSAAGIRDRTRRLGQLGQEIGSILQLINEVADQTNLLALNAAIEAARAGEAGRGFSVVADEVRKLAVRSQAATKDVQGLIDEIQTETALMVGATEAQADDVSQGASAAEAATEALSGIAAMADRTTSAAKEISFATAQQRSASEQVVSAMTEVSDGARQYAVGSQQSSQSATELAGVASRLQRAISGLKASE